MEIEPERRQGILIGIGIVVGLILLIALLLIRIVRGPINGIVVLCALGIGLLALATFRVAYQLYALVTLRYTADRNRMSIHSAGVEQVVPMPRIEEVRVGAPAGRVSLPRLRWPGCVIGLGQGEGEKPIFFYVTAPSEHWITVVTPSVTYVLSPPDAKRFVDGIVTRQRMGPVRVVEQETHLPAYMQWEFWRDRWAWGILLIALAVDLLLFAVLAIRFPRIPPVVPLHFDAQGFADRLGDRREIFVLPRIGLVNWMANAILGLVAYRKERGWSLLLWGGSLLVDVALFWVAWNLVF